VIFVKNPETERFLFFPVEILAQWFLHICSRKLATTPNFFFKWKGMPSDTSFESPLRKEYNALFVS
jgi:hypothetical protein